MGFGRSWAASTAGRAASESASDGAPSATYRALAWSQDDDDTKEPVPYAGADYLPPPAYPESATGTGSYPGPPTPPLTTAAPVVTTVAPAVTTQAVVPEPAPTTRPAPEA